ncbi:sterol desaturase family protein [Oceanicoccus sp. KOV_DT_Chl]|uniref:sterol desaturase family protein n=1 Tax=Oceanicoccus sp. KOV_DT_Chl TaxID=1904639 RepID=UPI000C7ACB9B|nr:sterol desaturase family protein [Oceanicoccus sp. KOV_DT_Chl]
MNSSILGLIVVGVFSAAFAIEWFGGRIQRGPRPARDAAFTAMGILFQGTISGALIGSLAGYMVIQLWGDLAGSLSHIAFWKAFLFIFLVEELLHYWIHRSAHEWRWLWKIHRTHHSAQQLNVGVVYRYNIFWVMLLPQTWMGAFATYFGQGEAFVVAVLITFFTNILTHSNYRWDLWLRSKTPWATPAWWLIERVITLPDTHHAHHAYGKSAHPNGNYAVTLFIYDIIFGTAKIPNSRQTQYGLPISARLHWAEELFWPAIKKPLLPKPAKTD